MNHETETSSNRAVEDVLVITDNNEFPSDILFVDETQSDDLGDVANAPEEQNFTVPPREFIIVAFPNYSKTNPYQDGLYSSFKGSGEVIYGSIEEAIGLLQEHPGKNVLFHLHWPEPLFAGVQDDFGYEVRASEFLKAVSLFQSMGGMFVWTIHNRLSHDRRYGDLEPAFLQKLAHAANSIHVHSEAAIPQINEYYEVDPRKCIVVPHGSYEGYYGPAFDKYQSRDMLGLAHAEKLLVFFGQLRPYKGIDELIQAFNAATAGDDHVHLLIVGKPMSGFTSAQARMIEESNPRIHVREGFVPDSKIPVIVGAADLMVLPYREILTSGSIMLAATYGKPVITPRLPTLAFVGEESLGIQYEPGVDGALEQAIREGLELSSKEARAISASATQFARQHSWPVVSDLFQGKIVETLVPSIETVKVGRKSRDVQVIRKPAEAGFIGIALVYYHSWEDISRLLPTIPAEVGGKPVKIYLFDNSSRGRPNYKVANLCDVYATMQDNIGYAAANNILLSMIKEDGCDYAFVLNPDTTLAKDTLDVLVANAKPGIVQSPLILDEDGTISYGGGRVRHDNSGQIHVEHLLEREQKGAAPVAPYSVHVLNGCALFLPSALLDKIGYIPEDYFLYYEETDWCLSARKKGAKLIVEPRATITHHKRSKAGDFPSIHYTYYLLRNKFNFSRTWNRKGSPLDLEEIARDTTVNFVSAWREKLAKTYPQLIPVFERCVQAAFEDGKAGVKGRIDLAARIDAVPMPDLPVSHGRIDKVDKRSLSGWFCQRTADADSWEKSSAWLFRNGSPLSPIEPTSLRHDVAGAGYSNESGFSLNIPRSEDGEQHQYEIRMTSDGRKLATSVAVKQDVWPLIVETNFARKPKLRSFLENIADGQITGWAADLEHPDVGIRLDVYVSGQLLCANVLSSNFRQDLKSAGIGDGRHAFALRVPNEILLRSDVDIEIRLAGSRETLQRKTVKVVNDSRGFSTAFDMDKFFRWAYIEERMAAGHSENATKLLHQFEMEKLRRLSLCDDRMEGPLASVIMPAFNRETVIADSINSVLQQSYGNFELLIIDDGSKDNTAAVVETFTDERIRFIRLEQNAGVSAARNVGLEHATGDIITYLDSDNIWDSDFLKIMVNALVANSTYECAYAGQVIYQVVPTMGGESYKAEHRAMRFAPFNRSRMEERNFIDLNVFVHKRFLYRSLGGFDTSLRRLVDWDLIMRYTQDNVPLMVPCLLSNYFIGKTDNQITSVEDFNSNRAALKIRSPIKLLSQVPATPELLNILVSCGSREEMEAWVVANARLLRSTTGIVSAVWLEEGVAHAVAMDAADWPGRILTDEDVRIVERPTDVLLEAFAVRPSADLLLTSGHYAVGGNWHSVINKAQSSGNVLAITGRVYGKPKSSRFGSIYSDVVPRMVAGHVESWSINSRIQGQVTRSIPRDYLFVGRERTSPFLQAATLASDIDAMLDIVFGFAGMTGDRFIYTPELVGCEYGEIPNFILG